MTAPKTSDELLPGTLFRVSVELATEDGMTFLKLADGRGWVFDKIPEKGVMCVRSKETIWRYEPFIQKNIGVRSDDSLASSKTGLELPPGHVFFVSEEKLRPDGITFLKLAEHDGWVFDRIPGRGTMCVRHKAPKRRLRLAQDSAARPAGRRPTALEAAKGAGGASSAGMMWDEDLGCMVPALPPAPDAGEGAGAAGAADMHWDDDLKCWVPLPPDFADLVEEDGAGTGVAEEDAAGTGAAEALRSSALPPKQGSKARAIAAGETGSGSKARAIAAGGAAGENGEDRPVRKRPRRCAGDAGAIPSGYLDVYTRRALLRAYRAPVSPTALALWAAPMSSVPEEVRILAEDVLHAGFDSEGSHASITELLGLKPRRPLRSGRQPPRSVPFVRDRWLLWETIGEEVVCAAVLQRQSNTSAGPRWLREGATLEYIASRPKVGGKAHILMVAAEEVCRSLGYVELFSAADLTQRGQAFQGQATSALVAHRRWGFIDMDVEEWHDRRFHEYTRDSSVKFMVKSIPPPD